jgi:uncharacterized protein
VKISPVYYVVFDCNIFLQAIARPNSPAGECLRLAESRIVQLFISQDILTEISEVLCRTKIQEYFSDLTVESVALFLNKVLSFSHFIKKVPPKFKLPRDVDDEPYINLAIACKANYLISRDNDLLHLMTQFTIEAKDFRQRYRHLKIVEPTKLLQTIREIDLSLKS